MRYETEENLVYKDAWTTQNPNDATTVSKSSK